jgi:hypothetical protein
MMDGLQLDISMGKEYDTLEATYRNEGLSVGADHMVSRCFSAFSLTFILLFLLLSSQFGCISVYLERMLG